MCARRRSGFLLLRQKKATKEKATLLFATPSLRYGATWGARSRGAPQNSLRASRYVQTTAVSQSTKHARSDARATPRPARPRRIQKGSRQTSTRAIAALGPTSRAQAPRAAQAGPERSDGPYGCSAVGCLATHPLLAAPAAGRLRGEHGRRSAHASYSDSPWLSERRAQRIASSTAHPATAPTQVRPHAQRGGRRQRGRLSFGYFSLAKQRTSTSAAGPRPGLRPSIRQALNY